MDSNKIKEIYRKVNLGISLFVAIAVVIQILLVVMSIGAVWVINILMPLTLMILLLNLGLLAFTLFQIIFQRKKEYVSSVAWMIGNQIMVFFSLLILFASGMTLVNF